MSSYFDANQGFFVRTPSWHQLESAVLSDWPGTWEEARKIAKLDWEPETAPVFTERVHLFDDLGRERLPFERVPGWQAIRRSDDQGVLAIQQESYRVINNTEFGAVIESVLGLDLGDELKYEGVFSLRGGKQVLAVTYFDKPLPIDDPSKTVRYAVFVSSHDGTGGLRCLLTNVRVVCANTLAMAEHGAKDEVSGFSIRHTANWDDRVAQVREKMLLARKSEAVYVDVMNRLIDTRVSYGRQQRFIKALLPVGTDMTALQVRRRKEEWAMLEQILASKTCEGVADTAYGLVQAATEWNDHFRRRNSAETYVSRQLVTRQPIKEKALDMAMKLAKVS